MAPSEDELVDWLTSRGDWLPLMGWNRHLVRSVAQLDPAERQRYLVGLVGDILEPEEQCEWQVLRQRQRDAVTQLVRFWRRRALDSSSG